MIDPIKETLATRARRLRISQGLSLEGLARRAGVSKTHIQHIEHGKSSHMRPSTLKRYAAALNVTQSFLESGYQPLPKDPEEWKKVTYEVALRQLSNLTEDDVQAVAKLIRRLEGKEPTSSRKESTSSRKESTSSRKATTSSRKATTSSRRK